MNKIINNLTGVRDMTAEEQAEFDAKQAEYAKDAPNRKLRMIKSLRQVSLEETDWMANSDYTMPDNIKTWRQQLRDLPQTYTTEAEYDTLLETEGEFPNQTLKHVIWSKP